MVCGRAAGSLSRMRADEFFEQRAFEFGAEVADLGGLLAMAQGIRVSFRVRLEGPPVRTWYKITPMA